MQERTHRNEVQVNPLVRVLLCCSQVSVAIRACYSISCSIVTLIFWQAALFCILSDAVAGSLDILEQNGNICSKGETEIKMRVTLHSIKLYLYNLTFHTTVLIFMFTIIY